jgi:hypothetical protein
MPFQPLRRRSRVLASVLAAASIMLAVASCSGITPLGPDPTQLPSPRHLGSPIIVQVMRVQPSTAAGECQAGWVPVSLPAGGGPRAVTQAHPVTQPAPVVPNGASPSPAPPPPAPPGPISCYRPAGTRVTITTAGVSSVLTIPPPPGQSHEPAMYGFIVAVSGADVARVTAIIRQAYNSGGAVGISVAGNLWQAPMVDTPFSGERLEVSLLSRNQALQLYRILVPSS